MEHDLEPGNYSRVAGQVNEVPQIPSTIYGSEGIELKDELAGRESRANMQRIVFRLV